MKTHTAWLSLFLLVVAGCVDSTSNQSGYQRDDTFAFNGRIWQRSYLNDQPRIHQSHALPPILTSWADRENPMHRLLVCVSHPSDDVPWRKLIIEQRFINGLWFRAGAYRVEYKDGRATESSYFAGKEQGTMRAWAANGQLIKEVQYSDGKRNGLGRYWDDDGNLLWEAQYKNDREVTENNSMNYNT